MGSILIRLNYHQSACVQESATELPHAAIFRQLVLQRGQEAVFFIMSGIGGALPRSSLPFMTELLHAFVIKYPDQTRLWLTQMLGTVRFPSRDKPRVYADSPNRKIFQVDVLKARRSQDSYRVFWDVGLCDGHANA